MQDRQGFIWLATDEGLSRYDGSSFVTYRSDEQTSVGGSCIREDRYGRIWYENFDGYLYYVADDSLKHLRHHNNLLSYTPFGLNDQHLFVVGQNGIDVFDLESLALVRTFHIPFVDKAEHASCGSDGFFLIANDVIHKIDRSLKLTSSAWPKDRNERIKQIYPCGTDVYVISKHNEHNTLYLLDRNMALKKTYRIPHPEFIQYSHYLDQRVWIHTTDGSYAYTLDHDAPNSVDSFFRGKNISGMFRDRQGNYWFTTIGEGVFIVPDLQNRVYLFRDNPPARMIPSGKGFLIGTQNGYLVKTDRFFRERDIVSATPGKAGIYYLYTNDTGNNVFYSSRGFSRYSVNNFSAPQHYIIAVKSIVQVDAKYYAIAANGFCALLLNPSAPAGIQSPWDTVFTDKRHEEYNDIAFLEKNIRGKSITYDRKENRIICASSVGISVITPHSAHRIKNREKDFHAVSVVAHNSAIYALETTGRLYCITGRDHFEPLSTKPGFPQGDMLLMKMIDGHLYFSDSRRLYRYDPATEQTRTFDIDLSPYGISDILRRDSSVLIVTGSGVIETGDQPPEKDKSNALFHINDITVNDKKVNAAQLTQLRYRENNIAVNFSVLDFGSGSPPPVFYRLSNGGWKEIPPGTRSLRFPALAPGRDSLIFRVGEQIMPDTIRFNIDTPFWNKWWFYLAGFIIVSGAGYAYYRNLLRRKLRQLQFLNEKLQLEQTLGKSMLASIRAQMNPHFFYNALNTIQAYIFTSDKAKATSFLAKFSRLTRMILEMSEKETITLDEEIEALTLYLELEQMRFKEEFTYTIQTHGMIHTETVELPSMIIQPYVENAVKHGLLHKEGDKNVEVSFQQLPEHLLVMIEDNGIGRKRSEALNKIKREKYQSFATRANEKRLELLNSGRKEKVVVRTTDKMNDNGIPAGTKVELFIPI